jgi:predicted dehydrogenase
MVQMAVIGAGSWGPNLIRNFYLGQRSCVRWIIDTDGAKLKMLEERYPGVRCSTRLADALADSLVDATVVATPTSTHFELAQASLGAGKHCLVEKPLTTSAQSSQLLCNLAREKKLVLMVGHVFLHNPAVRYIKALIDTGGLGKIYYADALRTNFGPIRQDINAAWDLASHDISIFNYWFDAEPVAAAAVGGAWVNGSIEDTVFGTLRYPKGQLAHLHASWLNPQKERRLTLVGDKKMLVFDDMNVIEPIRVYDKTVTTNSDQRNSIIDSIGAYRASLHEGSVLIPRVSTGEPLREECEHFLDCIEGRTTCESSGEQGLAVVKVLEAMSQSLRSNSVKVDVSSESKE